MVKILWLKWEVGPGLCLLGVPLPSSSWNSHRESFLGALGIKEAQLEYLWLLDKVQALSTEPKTLPVPPVSLPGFTTGALIMAWPSRLSPGRPSIKSPAKCFLLQEASGCLSLPIAPRFLPGCRGQANARP